MPYDSSMSFLVTWLGALQRMVSTIMLPALFGNLKIVEYLVGHGADISLENLVGVINVLP